MKAPKSLSYVATDGSKTRIDFGDDGVMRVRNRVDVEPIIDLNTSIRNLVGRDVGKRNKDEWRRVASIDMITYLQLLREGIIGADDCVDQKRFRAWLNDRDNCKFRMSEGVV